MSVVIHQGDALSVLRGMESESVQACISSPPYFQLRNYGVDGQIGLESSPAEFIATLVEVFREVRRVLRKDGTLWVNLGDSYSGSGKGPSNSLQRPASCLNDRQLAAGAAPTAWVPVPPGIPAKSLFLIPERFSLAMQGFAAVPGAGLLQMADELAAAREAGDWQMVEAVESQLRIWATWSQVFEGWIVRSRIAWCKTSAMPESVRDRPTSAWEHIWMFSRSRTYYYDAEAVKQPYVKLWDGWSSNGQTLAPGSMHTLKTGQPTGHVRQDKKIEQGTGANLRNFWLLGPEPSSLEHYAGFPTELPRRCILAGTSERGCCAACGAPWVRTVERTSPPDMGRGQQSWTAGATSQPQRDNKGGLRPISPKTTGWRPSCAHLDAETKPCVVLDIFGGSGTTGLVADRLGRDAILIELSPEYAEMARKRIDSDAPMLSEPVQVDVAEAQLSLLEALG